MKDDLGEIVAGMIVILCGLFVAGLLMIALLWIGQAVLT